MPVHAARKAATPASADALQEAAPAQVRVQAVAVAIGHGILLGCLHVQARRAWPAPRRRSVVGRLARRRPGRRSCGPATRSAGPRRRAPRARPGSPARRSARRPSACPPRDSTRYWVLTPRYEASWTTPGQPVVAGRRVDGRLAQADLLGPDADVDLASGRRRAPRDADRRVVDEAGPGVPAVAPDDVAGSRLLTPRKPRRSASPAARTGSPGRRAARSGPCSSRRSDRTSSSPLPGRGSRR